MSRTRNNSSIAARRRSFGSELSHCRNARPQSTGLRDAAGVPVAILIIAFAVAASAQEVAPSPAKPMLVTNVIRYAEKFRDVAGKVYNVETNTNWCVLQLKAVEWQSNGVVAMRMKPVLGDLPPRPRLNEYQQIGGYAPPYIPQRPVIGWEEDYQVFIRNLTNLPAGKQEPVRAIRAGVTTNHLELWDAGTPHVAYVVKTNRVEK